MNEEIIKKLGDWISQEKEKAIQLGAKNTENGLKYATSTFELLELYCTTNPDSRKVIIAL